MENGNSVAALLEAFLTRKQQRKERKATRSREKEKRRATETDEKSERQRRAAQLRLEFPSLKKTLQEIREFDVTLPGDLAMSSVEMSGMDDVTSDTERFSWRNQPNGLEARLKLHSSAKRTTPGMEEEIRGGKTDSVPKRRRESDVTSSSRWKKERRTSPDAKVMGQEGRKPRRRLVAVEREKVKDIIAPTLLRFHDLIARTLAEIDTSGKGQVRLLTKKILCSAQLEFPTKELFVEISVVDQGIGLCVGCADALLYVKEFSKGGESATRERLERLDPCDPGFPPASFPKKDKLCYQWMQRMIGNTEGTFFAASDLLGLQKSVTIQAFLKCLLDNNA